MERSTDKGRETLLSCRLSLHSNMHYKIFSALLYVENVKCAYVTLKSIAGLSVWAKRSLDLYIVQSFSPEAVCPDRGDIFSW